MTLTFEHAVRASGAQVVLRDLLPEQLRLTTDTRSIAAGDTFLALRGERFDGHDYVADAVRKGARAVVVDKAQAVPAGTPALVVADTKRAYMDFAAFARERFAGRVVGITGSTGKTTTKHLLAQLLQTCAGADRVLASPANENNELGVSKLLLNATEHYRFLVVEMGARHEGDVAQLARIARPHLGVLTNIGEAHLEIFGSREALARTKWGLFAYGAQAVLNAQDAESRRRAPELPIPPVWFSGNEPDGSGVHLPDAHRIELIEGAKKRTIPMDLRLPGAHNRVNAAAAIAAALRLGFSIEDLAHAVPNLTLPAGRYERIPLQNGTKVIYDAYNANLAGMLAALDAFSAEPANRRIAVLASMAELGADAGSMHERVGAHAARRSIDVLLASGDYAQSLIAGAIAAGFPRDRALTYGENAEAARWLREHAQPSDVVLLKGSRKYRMEEIVNALRPAVLEQHS